MLEAYRAQARLRQLLRCWVEYRDLVISALSSREVSPEREAHFMELKARIAEMLPGLANSIPAAHAQEGVRHTGQMTELLNRFRSLKIETVSAQREREEFDREWHENFIYLNKLRGMALGKSQTHGAARRAKILTGLPRQRLRRPSAVARFVGFLVQLGAVVLVLYLAARALGVHRVDGRWVAGWTGGIAGVWQNLEAGLQSIWSRAAGLVDPLLMTYGPTLTIVLVGVLLLGIGYWVFIRG